MEIEQPASSATAKVTKVIMYQINITDLAGNVKKQYKYSAGVSNTTVSIRGLSKGVYLIQAFDGTAWSSVQVIKQ